MGNNILGDSVAFDANWKSRSESNYTHWIRGEAENQVQLAFKNHWTLFKSLMSKESGYKGGKKVLEIGCGRGSLSCYFSDDGYNCTLVDLSASVLEIAQSIFKKNNLSANFVVGDTNALEFDDSSFDIIYSIGLLEHFEDIERPINEQIRVLNKGGIWFGYIVPKYTHNIQAEFQWVNDMLKGYYKHNIEVDAHKESLYRSDIGSENYKTVLKKFGMKNIKSSGVYPLPMISHSIEFPFSLMPRESELALVKYLTNLLKLNGEKTGKHPWLCEEGYGNAFLVWGTK